MHQRSFIVQYFTLHMDPNPCASCARLRLYSTLSPTGTRGEIMYLLNLPQFSFFFFTPRSKNRSQSLQKEKSVHSCVGLLKIRILLWEKVPGHLLLLGVLRKRKRTPIKATSGVYLLPTSSTLISPFLAVRTPPIFFSGPGCSLRDHMDEDMSPSSTDLFPARLGLGLGGGGRDRVWM